MSSYEQQVTNQVPMCSSGPDRGQLQTPGVCRVWKRESSHVLGASSPTPATAGLGPRVWTASRSGSGSGSGWASSRWTRGDGRSAPPATETLKLKGLAIQGENLVQNHFPLSAKQK